MDFLLTMEKKNPTITKKKNPNQKSLNIYIPKYLPQNNAKKRDKRSC